jgi:hypothetical protein
VLTGLGSNKVREHESRIHAAVSLSPNGVYLQLAF